MALVAEPAPRGHPLEQNAPEHEFLRPRDLELRHHLARRLAVPALELSVEVEGAQACRPRNLRKPRMAVERAADESKRATEFVLKRWEGFVCHVTMLSARRVGGAPTAPGDDDAARLLEMPPYGPGPAYRARRIGSTGCEKP